LAQSLGQTVAPVSPLPSRVVAVFPDEWHRNPSSTYLNTAWHNVPWDQPDIIRAIVAAQWTARRYRKLRDWLKGYLKRLRR